MVLLGVLVQTLAAEPRAIGFRDAIDEAVRHQPQVHAAHARERLEDSALEAARADALPSLAVSGSRLWFRSTTLDGEATPTALDSTLGALTLVVPLVRPRAWADWHEAQVALGVDRADVDATRRSVALSAGRAWILVRRADHVLAARLEAQLTASKHLDFSLARQAQGAATALDVLRARRELATVDALVEEAQLALARANASLSFALGGEDPVTASDDEPSLRAAFPTELANTRPDVERAHLALQTREAEVDDGWVEYLPDLSLEAKGFLQDRPTPTLPVSGAGWLAQLTLSLPLFDGGHRFARTHRRAAARDQAQAALDEARLTATLEGRVGRDTQGHVTAALGHAQRAASFAHQTLTLTESRYGEGAATDLEVIDALREARDADLLVAQAEDAVNLAALDVLVLAGRLGSTSGGW